MRNKEKMKTHQVKEFVLLLKSELFFSLISADLQEFLTLWSNPKNKDLRGFMQLREVWETGKREIIF